jgi:hypothetical protein
LLKVMQLCKLLFSLPTLRLPFYFIFVLFFIASIEAIVFVLCIAVSSS